jgi:hypothetical protein
MTPLVRRIARQFFSTPKGPVYPNLTRWAPLLACRSLVSDLPSEIPSVQTAMSNRIQPVTSWMAWLPAFSRRTPARPGTL